MSTVTVVGNVSDPQMKFTPAGKAVLEFSLAENHSKKNQQGGWDEDGTTWRKVAIWEGKAEALAPVLNKGDRVIVLGQERIREWEAKDGSKGKSLEMTAQWIGIIPKAQQASGNQPPAQQQSQGGWNGTTNDPWAAPAGGGGWGSPSSEPSF